MANVKSPTELEVKQEIHSFINKAGIDDKDDSYYLDPRKVGQRNSMVHNNFHSLVASSEDDDYNDHLDYSKLKNNFIAN
jgi:hypothetical protein